MMKQLLLILIFALPVMAQPSNIRVAANIGSSNAGFSGCLCGVTAGGDIRKGRFDFSADFDALHIRKATGGSGVEFRGRETGRIYFGKVFVDGSMLQAHYSVTQFSKTQYFAGVSAGTWLNERVLIRGGLLTHIGESSKQPNNQNAVEGSAQFFLKRHIYVSPRVVVSRFTSSGQRMTGTSTSVQVGFWF